MGDVSTNEHDEAMVNTTFFFSNKACAYFPCHEGVDPNRFNCMFCYCPLYALGDRCGGECSYTSKGYKDCSRCTIVHDGTRGAKLVQSRFGDLSLIAWENREAIAGCA